MPSSIVSLLPDDNQKAGTRRLIPEKLQKARKARAKTQTELAVDVGLTRQAISAYEQGIKSPGVETLARISSALDQPIPYFITESIKPLIPFSVRTYRRFGSATRKLNDQCNILTEWLSIVVAYIDQHINFPSPNIPEIELSKHGSPYSEEDIETAAEMVRHAWGLGDGPIGNLAKLIESRGIFIAHLPISSGKVNAFSYWSGACPFIVTGSDETTAVRRRFDLAHELGHLVLHQGVSEEELEDKETLNQIEDEANLFAGAFLLPRSSYPNEVFSTRLDSFVQLKSRWKVSISAQVHRCGDLDIFSEMQILNLRKQISFKKWKMKEPLDDSLKIEQPSMIEKAAKMAINSGIIDTQSMIIDINLSPTLIEKITGVRFAELVSKVEDRDLILTLK